MAKNPSDKPGREQRLASALRDNLRRRKAADRPGESRPEDRPAAAPGAPARGDERRD
jgi:hypothetical protein